MIKKINFLDLFAGAGGLSEGFIKAGFNPVAHVEKDNAACFTLKTRMVYHWLLKNGKQDKYYDYLKAKISRSELYSLVPEKIINSVLNYEISDETLKQIFKNIDACLDNKKLDLIIGGPPCQAYSLIGRSRDANHMFGDKRNYLYIYYAKFLKRYSPNYFIFENVTGLMSAKAENGIRHFDSMKDLFKKCGYNTEYRILSANEYGVPQKRKRVILVGKKGKKKWKYPEPEKNKFDIKVKDVFSDLPSLQAGSGNYKLCKLKKNKGNYLIDIGIRNSQAITTFHCARPHTQQDLKIYKIAVEKWKKNKERLNYNDLPDKLKTHKNTTSFTDRFKVIADDRIYSHTVVAHIARDGHYYIHPDIKQNRSLTPREAARLQTFPDDYFFESIGEVPGRTAAFRQIGNAVPVLLAEKIAKKLLEVW